MSIAIETIIAEHIRKAGIESIVKNALPRMLSELSFLKATADRLIKEKSLMVPIATFVANLTGREMEAFKTDAKSVKYDDAHPPSPPSSEPSHNGSEESRESRRSCHLGRNQRRTNKSSESSPSPVSVGLGSISRHSVLIRDVFPKKDDVPTLTMTLLVLDNFVEALDYRTYRLQKKSQHFDGKVARRVSGTKKDFRHCSEN